MPKAAPWSRMAGESAAAHQAFIRYRDLGARRSLLAVHETDRDGANLGPKSPAISALKEWSSAHSWVERCRAWDNHLQGERDKVAASEARKWERRRQSEIEKTWQCGETLAALVDQGLRLPLLTKTVETSRSPDGTVVHMTTIEPARWSLRDLGALLELAVRLKAGALAAADQYPAAMSDQELEGVATARDGGDLE
jgi:hypothetical protein